MSELKVTDIEVPVLLEKLKKREWLIPKFQREFVWDIPAIVALVESVIDQHPIGMATIWEQSDDSNLQLERISIPDRDNETQLTKPKYFGSDGENPKKVFAVLDGRQRCTALAMAFGGFRPSSGNYKYSGRYFLDVSAIDDYNRVRYFKETDLKRSGLTTDAACISKGLFPLVSFEKQDSFMFQWMGYLQALKNPAFYENNELPNTEELDRRDLILKKAFDGISKTKLAVYIVPDSYSLGEVCDIFETLNVTGTKVSTVDLIHSWLYSDTLSKAGEPLELREWMQSFGQKDGAIGWAVPEKRPELIAQIVTACHVALEKKYTPRIIKGSRSQPITSVKSPDLLATPAEHWDEVIARDDLLAKFIGDFQIVVGSGYFPYEDCPYPISSAIYVGLRWHEKFDDQLTHNWKVDELNALYKAFFWHNALSGRYDQGFLTQLAVDIDQLKTWLKERQGYESSSDWATEIQKKLVTFMKSPLYSKEELIDILTNGRPGGALQNALFLTMKARVKKDFIESTDLRYPNGERAQMHHIYPQAWCRDNAHGELGALLDQDRADRDWVNSVANMMPLSRRTNNLWKSQHPVKVLSDRKINYSNVKESLEPAFIDEIAFDLLYKGEQAIEEFWRYRASLIADYLLELPIIKI